MSWLLCFPFLAISACVLLWSAGVISLAGVLWAFVAFLQTYLFLSRTDPEPQEKNKQLRNLYTLTTSLVFPSSFLHLVTLVFIEVTLGATRDVSHSPCVLVVASCCCWLSCSGDSLRPEFWVLLCLLVSAPDLSCVLCSLSISLSLIPSCYRTPSGASLFSWSCFLLQIKSYLKTCFVSFVSLTPAICSGLSLW